MKRIFHPRHRTAWSIRTSNFPLLAVTASGGLIDLGGTRKAAQMIDVPEDTTIILWLYRSNSGRAYARLLAAEDGLPLIREYTDEDWPLERPDGLSDTVWQAVKAEVEGWLWDPR